MVQSGMATFSPQILPRPSYAGMQQEVLTEAAITLVRFPLLCVLFAVVTKPFYDRFYESTLWRDAYSWTEEQISLPRWVEPEDMLFTVVLSSSLSTVYLVYNGFFFLLDHFQLLQQYKMPRTTAGQPSAALIRSTLKEEAFAHIVVGPALMLFVVGPLIRWGGNDQVVATADVPSILALWKSFTVCFLCNEIMFYWGHRTLHSKAIYKHVHKQHHAYIGTRSFAAEYAHPLEDVCTAYIPFLTGLLLTGAHFHVAACWFWCRLTETYEAHSGYCFKGTLAHRCGFSWAGSAAHHDHHHTKNQGNFGWAVLDYAFGTMDAFVLLGGMEGYTKTDAKTTPASKVAPKAE